MSTDRSEAPMSERVVVHHPLPAELRRLLEREGYRVTATEDAYTVFAPVPKPEAPAQVGGVTKLVLSTTEVGQALGISRSGVYVLMAKGELRSIQIGGCRRIPAGELHAYIDRQLNSQNTERHTAL